MPHRRTILAVTLLAITAGCGKPNSANIELRKQNQTLRNQITVMENQRTADAATIAALQAGSPLATSGFPPERLDSLFTASGLSVGRLTGPVKLGPASTGYDAVRLYLVPTDVQGQKIKAAGAIRITGYNPDAGTEPVATWEFPLADAGSNWNGSALLYEYVLTLPLPAGFAGQSIRIEAVFEDGLTGRQIGPVERVIPLNPPGDMPR